MAAQVILRRIVDAQVEDLEARALHHHHDQVFANVMDVTLDCADDHGANLGRARFGQQWAQERHACLHGLGRHEHLRHKENPVPEVIPHDLHPGDEAIGQHVVVFPAAQRLLHLGHDLVGQTVVDIFLHQLIEIPQGTIRRGRFLLVRSWCTSKKIDSNGLDGNVSSAAAYVSRLRGSCYLTPATEVFPIRLASLVSCPRLSRCFDHRKARSHKQHKGFFFPSCLRAFL